MEDPQLSRVAGDVERVPFFLTVLSSEGAVETVLKYIPAGQWVFEGWRKVARDRGTWKFGPAGAKNCMDSRASGKREREYTC